MKYFKMLMRYWLWVVVFSAGMAVTQLPVVNYKLVYLKSVNYARVVVGLSPACFGTDSLKAWLVEHHPEYTITEILEGDVAKNFLKITSFPYPDKAVSVVITRNNEEEMSSVVAMPIDKDGCAFSHDGGISDGMDDEGHNGVLSLHGPDFIVNDLINRAKTGQPAGRDA